MSKIIGILASIIILTSLIGYADAANVPGWVKNNAGWWADDQIDDSSFVSGIQFLIEEGIITVPSTTRSASSSDAIPDWVKNNAGWWADGSISENDFLNGIQYLIKMGMIQVNYNSVGDDMSKPTQYQSQESETTKSVNNTGDPTLDELLLICQNEENARLIRDCEKIIKDEYNLKQYKTNSISYQVGPISYYYVAD